MEQEKYYEIRICLRSTCQFREAQLISPLRELILTHVVRRMAPQRQRLPRHLQTKQLQNELPHIFHLPTLLLQTFLLHPIQFIT